MGDGFEVESTAVVGLLSVSLSWYSGLDLKISPKILMVSLYQTKTLFLNVFAAKL